MIPYKYTKQQQQKENNMYKNIIFAPKQRSLMITTLGDKGAIQVLNWIRNQPFNNRKGLIQLTLWDLDIDFTLLFNNDGLIYFNRV